MPDNKIGIGIGVKTTGGEDLRRQIDNLKDLGFVSEQLKSIRRDAGDNFPKELKEQNIYLEKQIRLLARIEGLGSKSRIRKMEERMDVSRYDKSGWAKAIQREKTRSDEAQMGYAEASLDREQWFYRQKSKIQPGVGGGFADDMTDVMMSGRGGFGAMAGMAGGKMFGKARAMLGGMSGGAKLAAGVGVGTAALLGWAMYKFMKGGMKDYKSVAPEFANLMALSEDIPQGLKAGRKFELGTYDIAEGIAEGVAETITLQKEWMRLGGVFKVAGDALKSAVLTGKAFGLSANETFGYLGTRARAGYLPNMPADKEESERVMVNVIRAANRAGMPGARIPEFLQMYGSVMPQILNTAVTANSAQVLDLVEKFSQLGEPFRGQRGAAVVGGISGSIGSGGGLAFEAARRILIDRGEEVTPWALQRQYEKNLTDPANLKMQWNIAKELGSGSSEIAAFVMSGQFKGTSMKHWWDTSKDEAGLDFMNSFGEFLDEKGIAIGKGEDVSDAKARQRIADYPKTYGFKQEQFEVSKEVQGMIDASTVFGGATNAFHNAVINFGKAVYNFDDKSGISQVGFFGLMELDLDTGYDATTKRKATS